MGLKASKLLIHIHPGNMVDYHQPQPAPSLRHGDTCGVPGCPSVRSPLQPNGWWCAEGK